MPELDEADALSPPDVAALKEVVTKVLKPDIAIAEVGTWKGYSASIMAGMIKPHNGKLYCIDHWEGDGCSGGDKEARERDIFNIFRQNMVELNLWDVIHTLFMDSLSAAKVFKDNVLDLVFIDADHSYEAVRDDIKNWLPKVKDGGILCGHDYYRQEIATMGHRGVTKAVDEILGTDYMVIDKSRIWYHTKKGAAWQR